VPDEQLAERRFFELRPVASVRQLFSISRLQRGLISRLPDDNFSTRQLSPNLCDRANSSPSLLAGSRWSIPSPSLSLMGTNDTRHLVTVWPARQLAGSLSCFRAAARARPLTVVGLGSSSSSSLACPMFRKSCPEVRMRARQPAHKGSPLACRVQSGARPVQIAQCRTNNELCAQQTLPTADPASKTITITIRRPTHHWPRLLAAAH